MFIEMSDFRHFNRFQQTSTHFIYLEATIYKYIYVCPEIRMKCYSKISYETRSKNRKAFCHNFKNSEKKNLVWHFHNFLLPYITA